LKESFVFCGKIIREIRDFLYNGLAFGVDVSKKIFMERGEKT